MWGQMHFKIMISLAFALKEMFCTYVVSNAFFSNDFLSICLQSNIFVHMLCEMHFTVTISLTFASK